MTKFSYKIGCNLKLLLHLILRLVCKDGHTSLVAQLNCFIFAVRQSLATKLFVA